jgi:hypothetical protein
VGAWLPEPLMASADDDPARKAEIADSLSLAFLVLLESLSPEQRAAYAARGVRRALLPLIAGLRAATRIGGITSRREEVNGQPVRCASTARAG